jgi:hypothetical protein
MKFPYERRSTRLGSSTWRRIATLTLQTAEDAYSNAIYNGVWRRPVKARPESSRVPDSPISTAFPRTNGNADIYRTDNSRKREAELDVARRFVPAFSDDDPCHAIHR